MSEHGKNQNVAVAIIVVCMATGIIAGLKGFHGVSAILGLFVVATVIDHKF